MKNKKSIVILILVSIYMQIFALPINVSIIGHTDHPGVYVLDSSNRVSQAINYIDVAKNEYLKKVTEDDEDEMQQDMFRLNSDVKNDNTKKLDILRKTEDQYREIEETSNISHRRVMLIRDGESQSLNLQDFFLNGTYENNPYLQNNDIVKLLPIEYSIQLTGEINRAGVYEFLEGERISDVIEYGLGFTKDADLTNIRISRVDQTTGDLNTWTFDYNTILNDINHASNIELMHNDVIRVSKRPYLYVDKVVKVIGAVKYPGDYSIDDKSTLLSCIEKAGGPLPSADLNFAMLIDKNTFSSYDPDLERLLSLNITTMSVTEYSYYQTKLREISGKHFIDIKELWESKDKNKDRPVKDGDIIFIREPQMLVNVSGAVQNAGLQSWDDSKSWKDYIAQAGGYTNTAYESKIRVIRYDTNVWVKIRKDTVINPGDEIFVPEKMDRTFWDYFTEGLAITAQLITIVLGVNTLTK